LSKSNLTRLLLVLVFSFILVSCSVDSPSVPATVTSFPVDQTIPQASPSVSEPEVTLADDQLFQELDEEIDFDLDRTFDDLLKDL